MNTHQRNHGRLRSVFFGGVVFLAEYLPTTIENLLQQAFWLGIYTCLIYCLIYCPVWLDFPAILPECVPMELNSIVTTKLQ